MINKNLSYSPIKPFYSNLGLCTNFLIILGCIAFCIKKMVLFEQGSETTNYEPLINQGNTLQERIVFTFEDSSGPLPFDDDLKRYVSLEFKKGSGGELQHTIQDCEPEILKDSKPICISTQDGQLSEDLQILINKCDRSSGIKCQSTSKIAAKARKTILTVYVLKSDGKLQKVVEQKLDSKKPQTLNLNLQKTILQKQRWYMLSDEDKISYDFKGNELIQGSDKAEIFQTNLIENETQIVKNLVEYNLFNLCYEAGGAIYFLQTVLGFLLSPLIKYSGKIDLMKRVYMVKSRNNIFKSEDLNRQQIRISACWYIRLFFIDLFCCKCCYKKKSGASQILSTKQMNINDAEFRIDTVVQRLDQQKNVPSIGESMGRLMIEVNQRMSTEMQWAHLLKYSMPEGHDVIELDPQCQDFPTIEQIEKEMNQPTAENDNNNNNNHDLELKSFELSKDSYSVSNDHLTIYNDQTSKYSRSRNNFNNTDYKKTPLSGLTNQTNQQGRAVSYNRNPRSAGQFIPVTKDEYLVQKSPKKNKMTKKAQNYLGIHTARVNLKKTFENPPDSRQTSTRESQNPKRLRKKNF